MKTWIRDNWSGPIRKKSRVGEETTRFPAGELVSLLRQNPCLPGSYQPLSPAGVSQFPTQPCQYDVIGPAQIYIGDLLKDIYALIFSKKPILERLADI
ncbi:hypothetical protein N782_02255 [Pontibacillus yanchengensis Y32]|uniref:Uncharacterized protein n=1 Tax=Pontibacillus yanchengensis Y32 TaxID=1385514 RepID=A0A0A2TWW2_9BACI|nr:hypothetical protein N782_02255 [Pontibacillus yanchengensis Y32]